MLYHCVRTSYRLIICCGSSETTKLFCTRKNLLFFSYLQNQIKSLPLRCRKKVGWTWSNYNTFFFLFIWSRYLGYFLAVIISFSFTLFIILILSLFFYPWNDEELHMDMYSLAEPQKFTSPVYILHPVYMFNKD